jgi:hypothetical protein
MFSRLTCRPPYSSYSMEKNNFDPIHVYVLEFWKEIRKTTEASCSVNF